MAGTPNPLKICACNKKYLGCKHSLRYLSTFGGSCQKKFVSSVLKMILKVYSHGGAGGRWATLGLQIWRSLESSDKWKMSTFFHPSVNLLFSKVKTFVTCVDYRNVKQETHVPLSKEVRYTRMSPGIFPPTAIPCPLCKALYHLRTKEINLMSPPKEIFMPYPWSAPRARGREDKSRKARISPMVIHHCHFTAGV